VELVENAEALAQVSSDEIEALTEAATAATFYVDGLTPEQLAANRRVVAISAETCIAAAGDPRRHLVVALVDGAFAGYMIATIHAGDDRELDWMMVHPKHHGGGVARALMAAGIAWLGADRPMWLNVIRHNQRAIQFYRKFGFEIDDQAHTGHVVPHAIMRRGEISPP
jgi:ribosomal protein S18 acetylase RimI-like enzyme